MESNETLMTLFIILIIAFIAVIITLAYLDGALGFHNHKWSRWSEMTRGKVTGPFGKGYPVIIQERSCNDCGKLQLREVRV